MTVAEEHAGDTSVARALVFGGAGFIGRATCRALRDRGMDPVIADVVDPPGTVPFHHVDVRSRPAVERVIAKVRPRAVLNLASRLADATGSDLDASFAINVTGSQNVLHATQMEGVPRYVFASSIAVYGDQADWGAQPVAETSVGRPARLYGWHKLLHEVMIEEYRTRHAMDAVSLRISTVFGHERRDGLSAAVSRLIEPPRSAQRIECPWERDEAFDLIHVDDVAAALAALAGGSSLAHGAYNTGGEHATVGELVDLLAQVHPRLDVHFVQPSSTFAHCSRIDWERLREFVGPRVLLRTRMEQAASAHPKEEVTA